MWRKLEQRTKADRAIAAHARFFDSAVLVMKDHAATDHAQRNRTR
jgi:hypothetical protein